MAEEIRARDLWTSPKLNGRALDKALLLDERCDFPLPLMRHLAEHSVKSVSELFEVIEGEITRICAVNLSSPRMAGAMLAEQIYQSLDLKPKQKLGPQSGVSLADLDDMSVKEFNEWIKTLEKVAGVRVSQSH